MKRMKPTFFFALLIGLLMSCGNDEAVKQKVVGQWQGIAWTQMEVPINFPPDALKFSFSADDKFEGRWGDIVQKGTYHTRSDGKVFTRDQNNKETPFHITSASTDTLVLRLHVGLAQFQEFVLVRI
jgi:hypothetical protein